MWAPPPQKHKGTKTIVKMKEKQPVGFREGWAVGFNEGFLLGLAVGFPKETTR